MNVIKEAATEGLQALPPLAVSAATLHDKLDDAVLLLTAVYLVLQIAFMLRKHKSLHKKKIDPEEAIEPFDIHKD